MTAELWLTRAENLMKFIDVAIPKFGDDEPDNSPQRIAPPTQSRSYRPKPVEEYVLDDNRSVVSTALDDREDADSNDGKGTDQFYEARDDTTEVSRDLYVTMSNPC